jgi:NADH:ubiquinone oxidoreductase subunit 6 (subunit J)
MQKYLCELMTVTSAMAGITSDARHFAMAWMFIAGVNLGTFVMMFAAESVLRGRE